MFILYMTVFLDIYELLKDNLCQDDAVVGEAAGLAMGLVMIGTRSPNAIHDMIEVIPIIAPLYTCAFKLHYMYLYLVCMYFL